MRRSDVTGAPGALKDSAPPPAVYTVTEFAKAHKISVSMLYKMRAEGQGPDILKIGSRTLISIESARRWRAAREKATAA